MGKKFNYQDIENYIETTDCTLVTTEEEFNIIKEQTNKITAKVPIKLKCKCGSIFNTNFNLFMRKKFKACNICTGELVSKETSRSHQDFCDLIYKEVGNEYTILSEYKNKKTKILVRHNSDKCNNFKWEVNANAFLRGSRCPKCYGNLRKTTDEFKQIVYNLTGNEYEVLGDYKNSFTKILMKHCCNKCDNHEFKMKPNDFLNSGQRCPKCNGDFLKSHEQFESEIYNLVGKEYTLLEKYKNSRTKILVRHNECGYKYRVIPHMFLRGNRCPNCSGLMKKTTDHFKQEVFNLVGNEYEVLGTYKNNHTKILFKHNIDDCLYEFKMNPLNFLHQNQRCPKCAGRYKTTEDLKKQLYELVGDEYTLLSEYINYKTKIIIRHNSEFCNNYIWSIKPFYFTSHGVRCPICNETKGERVVRKWLENNNLIFLQEYMFNDLLSDLGNPLRFDFAIFKDEEKTQLKYLIEYDGEFHYKMVKYKGENKNIAEQRFRKQQYHDKLKDNYCNKNNIKLIRIPYWEFNNIEKMLNCQLN